MILEGLRKSAAGELHPWANSQGWEKPAPVILNAPPPHIKADLSCPWPMAAGKALRKKPLDVASEAAKLMGKLDGVDKAEAVPPGFINITLKNETLAAGLQSLLARPERCGAAQDLEKHRYLLEFVSANPTGPVHLASGRAATLGDSLAKILRRRGHEVATENYINDVGRQVQLLGESVKARREGKDVPEDGYKGDYIKEIAKEAPAEADSWTAEQFSKHALEKLLDTHRKDMDSFGVKFDRWYREHETYEKKGIEKVLEKLKGLGRVYDKDGAVWLGTAQDGSEDDKDRVLVRQDGRPTYFLSDIAYHQDKLDRGFDRIIDIWGADHHGYVPRMNEAMAALGCDKKQFKVIIHQLVRLYRGEEAVKMSKRAGEFVTLRELVEEVGPDACRFFFAMRTPNSHQNFDIELAKKRSQENPVYYVQYVHARCSSIFREAEKLGIPAEPAEDLSLLKEPTERALLLKLAWFPEVLKVCEKDLSPHPLPVYLMELAGLYHPFYEACRVLDKGQPALTSARLTLCAGVRTLIKEGLSLLGVSAPEKM